MINGNINEFISGLYYGDERVFVYNGVKYFIQGYMCDNALTLFLDIWDSVSSDSFPLEDDYDDYDRKIKASENTVKAYKYYWRQAGDKHNYPVEQFLQTPLFDGKTFWEVEQEIEWVDC